jgi:hypothetical protein
MSFPRLSKIATVAGCLALCLPAAVAQNSITLLSDSPIQAAPNSASQANPYIFQTTIQELNCPATGIYANISSQPSTLTHSNAQLLALDSIFVTVTPATGPIVGPKNVCPTLFTPPGPVCFNPAQVGIHGDVDEWIGQDPDGVVPGSSPAQTFSQLYGVGFIPIGSLLSPGMQSVQIQLENTLSPNQGSVGNSTLYLNTSCTLAGVSGPSTVVNGTTPMGGGPQTFVLNNDTQDGEGISFNYTFPAGAAIPGSNCLGQPGCITEHVSDMPIDPATFGPNATSLTSYTYGTSFSTASCFLHAGELLNNNPACKMFTLLCSLGTDPTESGANCPSSQNAAEDEIFGESFDPPATPALTLPDIQTLSGTYHTGVGLLMGPDTWNPGTANGCTYTPDSIAAEQDLMCPQNLLFSFSGPGSSSSTGKGENVNSTFITVYGVPEPLTTVTLTNPSNNNSTVALSAANGYWTNVSAPNLQLSATPPLGVAATVATGQFVAAPIQNISYGVTAPGSVPQPSSEQFGPIAGDTTLPAPTCPTVGYNGTPPATVFTALSQPLSLSPDGNYVVHYYAQDCAGTQELLFQLNTQVNPPSWFTSFYTYPINVDTVAPTVSVPTLSPAGGAYAYGQTVTANFACSDTESGLASCGGANYTISNGTGPSTSGPLSPAVPTTTLGGPFTYSVTATDFAGNSTTQSVSYSVGQASQAITGFTLPAQVVYTPPLHIPLSATGGGSGNPVTFTVHAGPGTINCTPTCVLTITGLGTVTVYANELGNANYTAAPQVAASVVVSNYLAPVISGLGASSVSTTSETLSATINPENAATSYFFTYGLAAPTTPTAPKVLAAGVSGDAVSATLVGLQPNTTYYYRITAKNLGGQVVASTLSFTTP